MRQLQLPRAEASLGCVTGLKQTLDSLDPRQRRTLVSTALKRTVHSAAARSAAT
jgi:hypothetical protein